MQCLKWQKLSLNFLFIFFKKGARGWISHIFDRYSKAKNKYLKSYDPKQESKHIYLDTNNLHGYAMSKFLPTGGLKWIDSKEFDLNKYSNNSTKECALEVDLEYPKELLQLRNDYPSAPDKIEIKENILSK